MDTAKLLAARLQLRHSEVRQGTSYVSAECDKNVITNFCADEHAWLMVLGLRLAQTRETIYDGIGGDVLSAGLFSSEEQLQAYRNEQLSDVANHWFGRFGLNERALSWLVREESQHLLSRGAAMERTVNELRRYLGDANPIGAFMFWNRTRREISLSPFAILAGADTVYCPYLDSDVCDFLMGLPGEMLLDKAFHNETISYLHGDFDDIPYGKSDAAQVSRGWRLALATVARLGVTQNYKYLHRERTVKRMLGVLAGRNAPRLQIVRAALYLSQLEGMCESDDLQLRRIESTQQQYLARAAM